jgi:hypothetical protein
MSKGTAMTQITREQMQSLKHAHDEGQFCGVDAIPYETLKSLIALGERIASGEAVVVPKVSAEPELHPDDNRDYNQGRIDEYDRIVRLVQITAAKEE